MKSSNDLRTLLHSINRKSYPAYKSLAGYWNFNSYVLSIDHVQGDPFAAPSTLHVEVSLKETGIPEQYHKTSHTRIALQDYLTRQFAQQIEGYNFKAKGSGKSGLLSISRCGQEILNRSACQISNSKLIMRFEAGFPAFGRTINAEELEHILFDFIPECVEKSLFYKNLNQKAVEDTIFLAEDQEAIRTFLKQNRLTSFIANGSILPRKSGVSQLPLKESVPFQSPESLECTILLPHHGPISGMALKNGITLIVGGGYHGKSTLLEAIQAGVYNHIRGDGREFVITEESAVKLRAEDGRSIRGVDISLVINDLPNKKDTTSFFTEDASGSTSQAAAVIEGIEAGARVFLIDEDTSATNFMVRDELMQQVISRKKEPITPFIERTRSLYENAGISTIMVAGSSGAFFYIADTILLMDCYHVVDITKKVKLLCEQYPAPLTCAPDFKLPDFQRVYPPLRRSTRDSRHEHMKIKAYGPDSFSLDKEIVNIRYLEQLVDSEQTMMLAYLSRYACEQLFDGKKTIQQVVETLEMLLEQKGFEAFCASYVPCRLALPRTQEIFACLSRIRA